MALRYNGMGFKGQARPQSPFSFSRMVAVVIVVFIVVAVVVVDVVVVVAISRIMM